MDAAVNSRMVLASFVFVDCCLVRICWIIQYPVFKASLECGPVHLFEISMA
jgi:hypothetical protein